MIQNQPLASRSPSYYVKYYTTVATIMKWQITCEVHDEREILYWAWEMARTAGLTQFNIGTRHSSVIWLFILIVQMYFTSELITICVPESSVKSQSHVTGIHCSTMWFITATIGTVPAITLNWASWSVTIMEKSRIGIWSRIYSPVRKVAKYRQLCFTWMRKKVFLMRQSFPSTLCFLAYVSFSRPSGHENAYAYSQAYTKLDVRSLFNTKAEQKGWTFQLKRNLFEECPA